ncbi:aminotransferase class I/II-fold pyridoxal phosphate-dependent enzyme [Kitasatospora indigofera]|uniref:aminotransferase class I/II-fold pyridoxal phosphate-dependent enzyme n=1 Tax=Kitasatospora indigofera TaxID=67307 RepID=UPI0033A899BC
MRAAQEIGAVVEAEFAGAGLTHPYFVPHSGISGATIVLQGRTMVNFTGFNYLGLAGHPRVQTAAKHAIDIYGTSASASRTIGGEIPVYGEMERRLARAYAADEAIITASGYLTNAGIIPFILGPDDLAVCDALVHSSIVSGTRWAQCRRMNFSHNDPDSLDEVLLQRRGEFDRAMVILEGVYSMDGDIARLPELVEVARRHDCLVMVDEAHSFGTIGAHGFGVREFFGLPADAVDIWMGTLSKTLASCGGYLAGRAELIGAIRMLAPGLCLFTTPPTPAQIAAAAAAYDAMAAEPQRLHRLRRNAEAVVKAVRGAGLDCGLSHGTPVVPIVLRDRRRTIAATAVLERHGIYAGPIIPPAIPDNASRIRLFVSADHTDQHIGLLAKALADVDAGG